MNGEIRYEKKLDIKKVDTPLKGLQIYHIYLTNHQELQENKTPSNKTMIPIEGKDNHIE
jgi:hypothetical protein